MKGKLVLLFTSFLGSFSIPTIAQENCIYQVYDLAPGVNWGQPLLMTQLGSDLIFTGNDDVNGYELFKHTGPGAIPSLIFDLYPGAFSGFPVQLKAIGTDVFFVATDGVVGSELFKYDGTSISLACDVYPGPFGSDITEIVQVGSDLYFSADNGVTGFELFKFDGTSAVCVADVNPGPIGSSPKNLCVLGSDVYFTADDGVVGEEMWRYSGGSPSLVMDIEPGPGTSMPSEPIAYGGKVLFRATNFSGTGTELYGCNAGSCTLYEINPGIMNGNPTGFCIYAGNLYFRGFDAIAGYELWKFDGTGVSMIADIWPGPHTNNSTPNNLVVMGGVLYFGAHNGVNGTELYKYTGSGAPTLAADIRPGGSSSHSNPDHMLVLGTNLYFVANNGTVGREIHKFDGAVATLGEDIMPGAGTSEPDYFCAIGTNLYFSADDGVEGVELWVWPTVVDLTDDITVVSCDQYIAPSGTVYNTLGTFTVNDTISSVIHDCDSIITIDLTVYEITETVTVSACEPYTTPSGGATYSAVGTYSIIDTIPAVASPGCDSIMFIDLTISDYDDPAFGYPSTTYCQNEPDPSPTGVVTPGGVYSATPGGLLIFPSTGIIDLSFSTVGTYNVKYVTDGPCPDSSLFAVTITDSEDATFLYFPDTYCQTEDDPSPTSVTTPGGTFSATPPGLVIDPSTGEIDLSASALGSFTIEYLVDGPCPDSQTFVVNIGDLGIGVTQDGAYFEAIETGAIYQWIKCGPPDFPIVGATGQSYFAPTNGFYAVVVTVGECTDTSQCYEVLYYGIFEEALGNLFEVFPNPVQDVLNVKNLTSGDLGIKMTDLAGKILMETSAQGNSSEIDMSDFASGVYYIIIECSEGAYAGRLVKQ